MIGDTSRYISCYQHGQVFLIGTKEKGVSRASSLVRKIDLDRNLVFTNSGSRLLKHVFNIDMEYSAKCGGDLKIIAAIIERQLI